MKKEELEHLNYLINKLKTKEKELSKEKGSFITSELYNITTNEGQHLRREKLLKGGKDGSAVVIVPFISQDKVLLCIEPRVFTRRTVGIGFPAGYIELDEDAFIAAQRELYEETGISNKDIELDYFMDLNYYKYENSLQVYYGILKHEVELIEEKNKLEWVTIDEKLLDNSKFAGNYNIPHIIRQIMVYLENGTGIDKY